MVEDPKLKHQMAIQSCSKPNRHQLYISRLPQTIMPTLLLLYWMTFRPPMIQFLFLKHKEDDTSLFFGNVLFYVNLHPSQNEAGIQNLPSERHWKLGSLFRPEIKINTHERLSLCQQHLLQREHKPRLQASALQLCHCRTSHSVWWFTLRWHSWSSPACRLRLWSCLWHHKP